MFVITIQTYRLQIIDLREFLHPSFQVLEFVEFGNLMIADRLMQVSAFPMRFANHYPSFPFLDFAEDLPP